MKQLPQISESEFKVMQIVWKYAPISTNEITEHLRKQTDWGVKTIHTLIKRLVNKGALTYEKDGRMFVYTPLVDEDAYIMQESRHFLGRFFGGNISEMLSAYAENGGLSEKDFSELQKILSEHRVL
ncbi:MAG: BlaI/MecI/CopY family transcriptional regulator [Lachnospiraceae bacterium]|nr:BlaI/MecI/CopY family transcriptional regulator [Lachnospiraceae bacterium]